ncbi:MAG: RNA 3'-phosphate cyclase [Planctomycetia bacterium 21-64-5]|nr:MAG: RNA 3'-phosphate cyclase [Planctomycetia bacterium 21-64-5]HQU44604.1 RNA 3'-terminal phosphate cyclase [Pirellulales bacterium]
MIKIDGSQGEGGGQILRTSLALAIVTRQPILIENIRAKRDKPGLRRQHLMAVQAAARISGGKLSGDTLGSRELRFEPVAVQAGEYKFNIGSAGSTTLVLQTILPPLLIVEGRSTIELVGGTHNPFAPPVDFLERAFLPLVNRLGPRVALTLERPGFYPAGGGRLRVEIEPASRLAPIEIVERGEIRSRRCRATVSNLPDHIADRELAAVAAALDWPEECLEVRRYHERNFGPGNIVTIEVESEHVTEVFTGFGRRGVPAETVAGEAAAEAKRYLEAGVPVAEHLADQLLLPLALAGGGAYVTLAPTPHAMTNIEIIRKFLDVPIAVEQQTDRRWKIGIG